MFDAFEHDMAIVAILKNEANYIKEWLDYHTAAGVSKFYLYDNESEDDLKDVLQPYIDAGVVDYMFLPGKAMQLQAYNDALEKHRWDCRFMGFIDADEFIYPKDGRSIPEVIHSIISEVPFAGGVVLNWRTFGSSGQKKKDLSKGVLERFKYRALDEFSNNIHIKTIVNPRRVVNVPQVHFALYMEGMNAIDEHGNPVILSPFNERNTADKICINHYFTKSMEEFCEKCARGRADVTFKRPVDEFEDHDRNDVYDDGIVKYREQRKSINKNFLPSRTNFALKYMSDVLKGETFSGIDVETVLCYWHICKKHRKEYLAEFSERNINKFFLDAIENKIDSGIDEVEGYLLKRYLPAFIGVYGEESNVHGILWKLYKNRDLCTVEIDIYNRGDGCGLELKDLLADNNLSIVTLQDIEKRGVTVQCAGEKMKLFLRCIGVGVLNVDLKGILRVTADGKRMPYWITFTSMRINGENILSKPVDVWHDQPLMCKKKVRDGEMLELEVMWQPCMKSVKELMVEK